ncbi:MAG: Ig-like domain-containing protein, partial [Candidatus Limivivens sp.]|nr:Ig-like domain-containing protein [Candidatus Limivivens sp.]
DSIRWSLKGQKNGQIELEGIQQKEDGTYVISIPALENSAAFDDWYQITVTARDKAGNQRQETRIFSVNRFGAVFQSDQTTSRKQESFYLNESFEPVLEIENVEGLEVRKLICVRNGQILELKPDIDFTETITTGENGWKKYQYRISKECFSEEGSYSVVASTTDLAGNRNDSRNTLGTLSFVIDRTPPTGMISCVRDDAVDSKGCREVAVYAEDPYGIKKLELWVNGEIVYETEDSPLFYTLSGEGGQQILNARMVDAAGNEAWTKPVTLFLEEEVQAEEGDITGMTQETGEECIGETAAEVIQTAVLEKNKDTSGEKTVAGIQREGQETVALLLEEEPDGWMKWAVLAVSLFLLLICIYFLRRMDFR